MRTRSVLTTSRGTIDIIHDAGPADVTAHPISPDLDSIVHNPGIRRTVYLNLAADPEARLTLAVADGMIVGRAAVGPSFGRWRELPRVREFAIEVSRPWRRGTGLAATLARVALGDPAVEEEILLAFALPAAWDLDSRPVAPATYRRALALVLAGQAFVPLGTDEPEVVGAAGASLFARTGARVPARAVAALERARYVGSDAARDAARSGRLPTRVIDTLVTRLRRMLRAA